MLVTLDGITIIFHKETILNPISVAENVQL